MDQGLGRSVLALGVAIGAWSLSPLLIVRASGLASPPVVALYAVVGGTLLAAAATARSPTLHPRVLLASARRDGTLWRATIVGAGAFVAYPLLYFSAIQNGPPVLVNLVNYLWPIVGLSIVSILRRETRSIELLLAGGFGFAGATLAILAGGEQSRAGVQLDVVPFALAVAGALVYGGVSAYVNKVGRAGAGHGLPFLLLALFSGGATCSAILLAILVIRPTAVIPDLAYPPLIALGAYALLLPFAHLSWFTAIRHPRVPGFSSAFLVPVLATAILALLVDRQASPEILSALTLVLCGIAFSVARERGIPVAFAVTLAALGSIQISQTLRTYARDTAGAETELLSQLLVGLVAILAGFILTNAMRRYTELQSAFLRFYAQARTLSDSGAENVNHQIDRLEGMLLGRTKLPGASGIPADLTCGDQRLAREWSDVEIALDNRVSKYEWLVLSIGSGGIILAVHSYAITSMSSITSILRSLATAVVVGILFAIRDYDLSRPERMVGILRILRRRFGFTPAVDSPLLSATRAGQTRAARLWLFGGLSLLVLAAAAAIAVNA